MLIASIVISLLFHYPKEWYFYNFFKDFYANVSTELFSIAVTILLIDYLYEQKEKRAYKNRLINELGSGDIGFSSRALKELKQNGWLTDGTLMNANLKYANWTNLDLSNANLTGADISDATLVKTNLSSAKLRLVKFHKTDLSNCTLDHAILMETKFHHSTLFKAKFYQPILKETDFLNAQLHRAVFVNCEFKKCKFEEAVLEFTDFAEGIFEECNFQSAEFNSTNLENTTLTRCELKNIKLWDAAMNLKSSKIVAPKDAPDEFINYYQELILEEVEDNGDE